MNHTSARQRLAWQELKDDAKGAMRALDYRKAEELLIKAYQQAQDIFGTDHGEVGLVLIQMLELAQRQGKHELAHKYQAEIDRIVEIYREAAIEDGHIDPD